MIWLLLQLLLPEARGLERHKTLLEEKKSLHRIGALWNSGIVVVKNSYLKSLFNQFNKKIYSLVRKSYANSRKEMEFIFLDKKSFKPGLLQFTLFQASL